MMKKAILLIAFTFPIIGFADGQDTLGYFYSLLYFFKIAAICFIINILILILQKLLGFDKKRQRIIQITIGIIFIGYWLLTLDNAYP